MKGLHLGHCLVGAVVALVILVALGVPAQGFVVVLALAACPLMMFLMMRTMMGGNDREDREDDRTDAPT